MEGPWKTAIRRAKLSYNRPYVMRHSFAAWAMSIRADINKLEYLMGHSSKKMLYETYGKYTHALEEDYEVILDYFGEDFRRMDRSTSAMLPQCSESLSESWVDKRAVCFVNA